MSVSYFIYVNKEKTANWLLTKGSDSPNGVLQIDDLLGESIPNEKDLVKVRVENIGAKYKRKLPLVPTLIFQATYRT